MGRHHPPHIFLDDTWFIITCTTHRRRPLLRDDSAKLLLRDTLKEVVISFGVKLRAWVILDEHYHLLMKSKRGEDLPDFFRRLHAPVARDLNRRDGMKGRQVWHNYWDRIIRNPREWWTRFVYIHRNPVKHGYVTHPGDWPFSSYGYYRRTRGQAWLDDVFRHYGEADFLYGDDDF